MKKYILSESQVKKLIDKILTEQSIQKNKKAKNHEQS